MEEKIEKIFLCVVLCMLANFVQCGENTNMSKKLDRIEASIQQHCSGTPEAK